MSKYIRIAVSAILLTVIAWRTDWSVVADKFANLEIGFWLAAVGVLVAAQFVSARRWQIFARELRFGQTLRQYSAYYFIGMYFNLALPTSVGGDVMRVFFLDAKSGRKLAAFASVLLDRANGLVVLIAMACLGVLIAPVALPWWIHACVWGVAGAAVVGIALLPVVQNARFLPVQRRQQIKTMILLMRIPRVFFGTTAMSILVQAFGVFTLWLVSLSLGLEIPIAYCCVLGPMVSLLTLLPISVNGMGVRELGTVVFLAPMGVDADSAKTLAFLWFAVNVAVSLLGGLVYLAGAYPKAQAAPDEKEGTADHGPVDRDSDQGREGQHQKAA
ncbi:MAG: flippase-like domain-containing protein [Planctomycetes bacterium]|nr:flippase-like domain-containing protein [Planctomycetota bacterium]